MTRRLCILPMMSGEPRAPPAMPSTRVRMISARGGDVHVRDQVGDGAADRRPQVGEGNRGTSRHQTTRDAVFHHRESFIFLPQRGGCFLDIFHRNLRCRKAATFSRTRAPVSALGLLSVGSQLAAGMFM